MEFDTFDGFLDWFEKQKPEWQPVLAARIALRALPVAFADKSEDNPLSSEDERILLQLFRAVLALDDAVRWNAGTISPLFLDALSYFDEQVINPVPRGGDDLASLLVLFLKIIADFMEREQDIYGQPEKEFRDRRIFSLEFDLLDMSALSSDLRLMDTISPSVLNTMPLFPDSDKAPFGADWPSLMSAMQVTEHGWDVWEQYYWSRLTGSGDNEALILATNRLSVEDWLNEPSKINPLLTELLSVQQAGFGEEEQEEISYLPITDRESFAKWLIDKPVEWAQVLVMRIALRALPLAGKVFSANKMKPAVQQELIISVFRACSISWASRKYTAHDMVAVATAAFDAAANAVNAADVANVSEAAGATANAADAAYAAANASDAAAYAAVNVIWSAINLDVAFLESRTNHSNNAAIGLASQQSWLDKDGERTIPNWALTEVNYLNQKLLEFNDNWLVWIEWYQSRLEGMESWGLTSERAELLAIRIAQQNNAWWEQGPNTVNAEIAGWLAELREEEEQDKLTVDKLIEKLTIPIEPEQSVGLAYGFSEGKLSATGSRPLSDEAIGQESLIQRVKTKAERLNGLLITTANQYPELADAAAEYLELIGEPIEQIDIDSLWSVGGALFELKTAYASQNHKKTMSAELEPPQTAALSGLCRDHGAFILGFERGEELVERADRFAQNIQRVEEIIEPSKPVLTHLTDDRELVEDETRKLHKVILDALNETDWTVSRTSYSAYVTIKNGTLSIAKLLFGSMGQGLIPIALQFAGAAAIAGYNVDQTAVINAVQFMQLHGAQLLTIFKHSPEMHAYIQAAIDLIKREKKLLKED